jgi:hypothetical protein
MIFFPPQVNWSCEYKMVHNSRNQSFLCFLFIGWGKVSNDCAKQLQFGRQMMLRCDSHRVMIRVISGTDNRVNLESAVSLPKTHYFSSKIEIASTTLCLVDSLMQQ